MCKTNSKREFDLSFFIKEREVSYECFETDKYDFFILSDKDTGDELGDGDRDETEKLKFYKELLGE